MQAGSLDRRIVIQSKTAMQNEYGEPIETWADLDTVWARYLPGGGNERFTSAQVYAETQGRFRIRWRDDVTPAHRIIEAEKVWDILSVDPLGRKDGLEIKVKARA